MNITKETKRLISDVTKAIYFIRLIFKLGDLSALVADIVNIPIRGINNNKVKDIAKEKRHIILPKLQFYTNYYPTI